MSGRWLIGPVDTTWLNMDRPNNLMVIDSLVFFDEPVDWRRLTAVLQDRLVDRFPVFRKRPVPSRIPLGLPRWEDDPDFSLEHHLRRATLPVPGDDETLQRYMERYMREPFDRRHPLWEMHLIDGYGAGAAMFSRYHHALSDGIALARVLLSLTDATPDGGLLEPAGPGEATGHVPGAAGAAARAAETPEATVRPVASGMVRLLTGLPHLAADLPGLATGLPRLVSPRRIGDLLVQAQRTAAIANKLLLGHNPVTALDGTPGVKKRAVWAKPFPLAEVKHLGQLADATVNDVLLSAVAGAIYAYLTEMGDTATDLSTMVPVNVRPLDRPLPRELGNRFALVMFKLPSGLGAPVARLAETKRRMDVIKHSPEVALTFGLITAIGRTSKELERALVNFFADKTIGVMTNVAGPNTARYLAGAKVAGVLAWVPSSGRQTVGVCVVTYNQTVRVGFKVDADTVREPERLVRAFDAEVDRLRRISQAA